MTERVSMITGNESGLRVSDCCKLVTNAIAPSETNIAVWFRARRHDATSTAASL
jgi:hypothetical protein